MRARLIDAASTLVAHLVCALVWAVDAGRQAIDVGGRWGRVAHFPQEGRADD